MHENDDLDRMLDSSLTNYGDPGPDSGLAERILARISSEQRSDRSAPRWRSRFLLWAALPAAACLLLTLFIWKPAGPGTPHQSASLPQAASAESGSKAPKVADVTNLPIEILASPAIPQLFLANPNLMPAPENTAMMRMIFRKIFRQNLSVQPPQGMNVIRPAELLIPCFGCSPIE